MEFVSLACDDNQSAGADAVWQLVPGVWADVTGSVGPAKAAGAFAGALDYDGAEPAGMIGIAVVMVACTMPCRVRPMERTAMAGEPDLDTDRHKRVGMTS